MPALHLDLEQRFDKLALQWYALAERRLNYFIELYRSGRWTHYYTKESFTLRMADVILAKKAWSKLADRAEAERSAHDGPLRSAA